MALTCNVCNMTNSVGAKFCNQCGAALQGASASLPNLATGLLPAQAVLRAGRYQVLETVGQGGMGAVYKALDLQLSNRVVAIKEMSQQGLAGKDLQEAIAAFTREASMLAHLKHPSLPRIYEQFEDGGRRYLVMEFIEGETLEQQLEAMSKRGQHFSLEQVLDLGCKLCVVLEYLHAQQPAIIFRDLKPGNIMLSQRGPTGPAGQIGQVYLIDFGIARFFKPGQAKDTVALGSAGYAPPEQYRQASSPRSDIYSLGATLHYAMTGDDPTQNPFLFRRFSANQSALERLILSMVTLDEQMRPESMQDVRQKLAQIMQQLQQPKAPLSASSVTMQVRGNAQSNASGQGQVQSPRGGSVQGTQVQHKPAQPMRQGGIAQVNLGVLLSAHPLDQQLWQSIRGQLFSLIDGFPAIQVQEIQVGNSTAAPSLVGKVDSSDPLLFLLSQDFVDSAQCMAIAQRGLDRRDTDKIETLAIYLRPCSVPTKRLAALSRVPEDAIAHTSLYAQEQRVLEVAKEIRRVVVTRIMAGKKTGQMNLLHWLLWQLYGYGQGTCPYFTTGAFFLRNMRPSGLAGIMLHLYDLHKDRMLGEYIIGPILCNDLVRLLQVIAPSQSDAIQVIGVAGRGNPAYKREI